MQDDEAYRLDYSPAGIREHLDGTESRARDLVDAASDEELRAVSDWLLGSDELHAAFHEQVLLGAWTVLRGLAVAGKIDTAAAGLVEGERLRVRSAGNWRTIAEFSAVFVRTDEREGVYWVRVDDDLHPLNGREVTVNGRQLDREEPE